MSVIASSVRKVIILNQTDQVDRNSELRTQRILGKLIKEGQQRGEIASQKSFRGNQYEDSTTGELSTIKTLSDIGISRKESSDYQTMAAMPEEEFEKEIAIAKQESDMRVELTTARARKLLRCWGYHTLLLERTLAQMRHLKK